MSIVRRQFLGGLVAALSFPSFMFFRKEVKPFELIYNTGKTTPTLPDIDSKLDHHIYLSVKYLREKRFDILRRYLETVKYEFPEINIERVSQIIDNAMTCADKYDDGFVPMDSILNYKTIDIVKYGDGKIRIIFLPHDESKPNLQWSGKDFMSSYYGFKVRNISQLAKGTVVQ